MMTPEEMRIAIAEKCGRNGWWCPQCKVLVSEYSLGYQNRHANCTESAQQIPNYPSDLNAMHEAELTLTDTQYYNFAIILANSVMKAVMYQLPRATALQRAEAFCRVFWPERFEK